MENTNFKNIIVFEISKSEFDKCFDKSLDYAISSLPFTINRMNLGILARIKNIIKGKIAENLLFLFFEKNNLLNLLVDTSTPFYQIDRRDFILGNYEWDIKNNFFHCKEAISDTKIIENFYGLVPNRHEKDQWHNFSNPYSDYKPAILFTFMFDLNFSVNIPNEIKNFLEKNYKIYQGKPLDSEPKEFINELNSLLKLKKNEIKWNITEVVRKLFITGFVTMDDIDKFIDLPPNSNFPKDNYNCFYTRIKNKAIVIKQTRSFKSFLNDLQNKISK